MPNEQTLDLFDGIMKGRLTNIFVTIFGITTDGKASQSYELGNCDVVSVAFPSLDGASKDTGLTELIN